MDEQDDPVLRDILDQAADLPTDQRPAFLDALCAGNAQRRAQVEALLATLGDAKAFLSDPTLDPDLATESLATPLHEGPGSAIGRYKLLEQIGEGGFGVVFMAEQQKPVVRKVALKIIKLGMDTKQVIARFEAERQALAMMDHPNIAKVLEAGATDTGRPYFVMELVRGVPITTFCNDNKLTTKERLSLFIAVCSAVQHAHQKGIIHRDLKPTNVLVTMHDDKPVPKIIDFGVAKATQSRLTDKTLFTGFKQMIGTPAYMSPEQAQMSGLDVDTRSDIYSLGVLLYELLTGTTPFDARELRSAAYEEMRRIIREVEPPLPSNRVSTLGHEALTTTADQRRCDPKTLTRTLKGDLDWIIMKALEKDRTRRYETASNLGKDLERHLADEPVQARPASVVYRLRKFARRHKPAAAAVILLTASVLLGIVGTGVGLVRARSALAVAQVQRDLATERQQEAERQTARAEAARDFLTSILSSANPNKPGGREVKVADLLDAASKQIPEKFQGQPELEIEARLALAQSYGWLGLGKEKADHLRQAYLLATKLPPGESERAIVRIGPELALALNNMGENADALRIATEAHAIAIRLYGPGNALTNRAATQLGNVLLYQRQFAAAEALWRGQLQWADEHPAQVSDSYRSLWLNNLAGTLEAQGKSDEVEDLYRRARLLDERNPNQDPEANTWVTGENLALYLLEHEKYAEAKDIYKQLIPELQTKLGATDKSLHLARMDYARALLQTGDYQKLLSVRQQIAAVWSAGNAESEGMSDSLYDLADAYALTGQEKEADQITAEALAMMQRAKVNGSKIKARWRAAVLRAGLGEEKAWKSPSLRSQVWCTLDESLADQPAPSWDLEDIVWPSLHFKLQRWIAPAGATPHVDPLADGGLDKLQSLSELDPGVYLLSLDVERAKRPPMPVVAWITLAHWDASLYALNDGPETVVEWRDILARPATARRSYGALALSNILSRDAGPGGLTTQFGMVATATLRLPAGKYRLLVTSSDGIRVDYDGHRVIDSWVYRSRVSDDASVEMDGAAHVVRIDHVQLENELKLWMRLEPLATDALVLATGPRTTFQRELETRSKANLTTAAAFGSRGDFYARHGMFREAAADFDQAMKLDPSNYEHGWYCAYAYFQAGQEQEYRNLCATLLERFAASPNDACRERLARAFALLPDAVDIDRLVKMIDLSTGPEHVPVFRSLICLAKGVVLYRAGDWKNAADALAKSLEENTGSRLQAAAYFFLAMAQHHLNQPDNAEGSLKKAMQIADSEVPPSADLGDLAPAWDDWILAVQARKEAEALLKPAPIVPAP